MKVSPQEKDEGIYYIKIFFKEMFTEELYSLSETITLNFTADTASDAKFGEEF